MIANPLELYRTQSKAEKKEAENIPIQCVGHYIEQHLNAISILTDNCCG
jgi:hypothetical protein